MKKTICALVAAATFFSSPYSFDGSANPIPLTKAEIRTELPSLIIKYGTQCVSSDGKDLFVIKNIKSGRASFDVFYHPSEWSPADLWIVKKTGSEVRKYHDACADMNLNGFAFGKEPISPDTEHQNNYLADCSNLLDVLKRK